jgi:hypothetical protein
VPVAAALLHLAVLCLVGFTLAYERAGVKTGRGVQSGDPGKAREQLGWEPTVTFSELVSETWVLAEFDKSPVAHPRELDPSLQ